MSTLLANRRIIINADDLGFSVGVTDGILQCHREGVLTSATLMTTMPDRDRAIELAKSAPTLGVGIHLCLTQGTPLTKCDAITRRGQFPRSLPKLAFRLMHAAARDQAVEEWSAQVAYAIDRGLRPTHVDSHKHIHHLPALQDAVLTVAERFGIRHVRCARELSPQPGWARPALSYRILMRCASGLARKMAAKNITATDWFYGLATTGRTTADVWRKLIAAAPPGVGEVMVHPGFITDITAGDTRLLQERLDEQAALLDPTVRDAFAKGHIELTHYGKL